MHTRADAIRLLEEWVPNPALRNHMKAVEAAVRAYARSLGQDEDRWGLAGLLHDLDWEKFPEEHPLRAVRHLREQGWPEEVLHAILAHRADFTGTPPETPLDRTLVDCDELAGLITATALVRPTGIEDLTAKSVRKKMKDPTFARGVNRDEITHGAALLGVDLDVHIQNVIEAMKSVRDEIGLARAG